MQSIAVIGGGITGVTTAYALAWRGFLRGVRALPRRDTWPHVVEMPIRQTRRDIQSQQPALGQYWIGADRTSLIATVLSLVVRDRKGLWLSFGLNGEVQALVPLGQHHRPHITE